MYFGDKNWTTLQIFISLSCVLLVLLGGSPRLAESSTTPSDDFKVFSDKHGTIKFNHLVVDKDRGWVFIGAVNRLYQLSRNLDLVVNHTTGPEFDSPECSVLDCPHDTAKKSTDNYNKALVIDYTNPRLISCGSVLQGLCKVHNIKNISDILAVVLEPVVANNATASTVAFIAPGPVKPSSPSFVLCVGVTYTGNSAYRSEVPAVASRSLESNRMLAIAEQGVTTGTRVSVNNLSRERYIINYVYGFSSGSFSYFLTTQMKSSVQTSPYISKLIRICHEDKDYYSYTEIPIECIGEGGRLYNLAQAAFVGKPGSELATSLGNRPQDDVLFVIFAQSETPVGDKSNKPSKHSALCIYSLNAIKRKFIQNINNCFSGKGSRGLDFILSSHECIQTKIRTINEDFCGLDVNTPLGGKIPVPAVPVITFNITLLTSVAATSTGDYTVVFIGTNTGHLKKVVVENSATAFEYADLTIDEGSPVNSDLLFDSTMNYLYVMTKRKLTKIKVQDCSKYETCWDCLTVNDPYCGWCSLEYKCSLRSNCQDAANDALSWIPYTETGKCTSITSVTPKELQRTTARNLELTINNLPPLTGQFLCVFAIMDKVLVTNATRNNFGVNCTTPRTDLLPSIPPGHHHFTAKLSVKTTNNPKFVYTNFTFFDCNNYTSCTPCVSSIFPCDWCVDGHRCTHNTAENCRNDILVTGVNRGGPSYRSGPTFCPTINATSDGSTEILVPAGTKKSIRVKIHIIGQFIVQTRFLCQFNIEGRVTSVNADLIGDTIYCEQMEFAYTQRGPNMTATFAVIWGGSKPLDNPDDIHVVIYKCRDMVDNCGMCLVLDKKYGCGWCQSTNRCEIMSECDIGWLDRNHTCPNPTIINFRPQLGPWEGGTNVTIQGTNLGRTYEDVYITVAGIPCEPYKHLYKLTREIVCKVDGPGTTELRSGPAMVKVDNFRGESKQKFTFVDPKIEEIFPKHGPRSGGTELTIKGKYMNAGSLIEVFIDELPCKVFANDSTETKCITSASNKQREGKVTVKFDQGGNRLYEKDLYEYTDDPTIESLESGVNNLGKIPKGIPAGGIKISVSGKNLLSIQKPLFYMYNENHTKQYYSECEVHSNSLMTCLSPYIPEINSSSIDAENPKHLDYGFKMDGVSSVQNISMNKGYPPFTLYPNPIFDYFPDSIKYYKSDYLTINGQNIDRACHESDVVVQIGKSNCNVTSLSRQQLTCRPLETQLAGYNNGSDFELNALDPPEVIVSIGQNFRQTVGRLSYSSNLAQTSPLTKTAIYGGVVGILMLILVFVAFFIMYRKKSTSNAQTVRRMQVQIDKMGLESIAMAQCIKTIIIEKQIDLDGNLPNILKLPNVSIGYMPALNDENTTEMPPRTEFVLPVDPKWEFPRNNLTLGKPLGEGEFGKVVRGEAIGILEENFPPTVAVKMLKDSHTDSDMIDLVSEMEIMKLLGDHTNVLRLLGCCTQEGGLFIITEYAFHGNLLDFLRKHHPTLNQPIIEDLSEKTLLNFAIQIANGMEHLASIRCIHRDLAARNILVSDDFTMKIADFGLARDIGNKDYYRKKSDGRLPVKWMAPEALSRSLYTTQSDVWSYGILLWEILSLGDTPYPSYANVRNLLQDLKSGYRMEKPSYCSMSIYSLMLKCWNYLPEDRPTFFNITESLNGILSSEEFNESDSHSSTSVDSGDISNDEVDHLME